MSDDAGIFGDFVHIDIIKNPKLTPQRTDIKEALPHSKSIKQRLFCEQEGICKACAFGAEIHHFEVDHILQSRKADQIFMRIISFYVPIVIG